MDCIIFRLYLVRHQLYAAENSKQVVTVCIANWLIYQAVFTFFQMIQFLLVNNILSVIINKHLSFLSGGAFPGAFHEVW
jgi:hypothetical protein